MARAKQSVKQAPAADAAAAPAVAAAAPVAAVAAAADDDDEDVDLFGLGISKLHLHVTWTNVWLINNCFEPLTAKFLVENLCFLMCLLIFNSR